MYKEKIMTFTKTELAFVLMSNLSFSRQDARKFVSTFFNKINESLCQGESVKLSGVGNFILRDKKSRPGRNPKTKEDIAVTARRVVTFQPSQTLKKKMIGIWSSLNNEDAEMSSPSLPSRHSEKRDERITEHMM